MTIIKNAIVAPIQKIVGSQQTPSPTILDDDNISLTLPISPNIIRRSLSSQPTGGWFQGVLENVHSAADDEASEIFPYNAGDDAVAPYPTSISADFDLWLLSVFGFRSSGAGGLNRGVATMNPPSHAQGWGRDDAGASLVTTVRHPVAAFDGIVAETAATLAYMQTELQGLILQPVGLRLPRGCTLGFNSSAAAAAEFQMVFTMGLFPAALGQDVAT